MKLIIGAEIEREVSELFRPIRAKIQNRFNEVFESNEYGLPKFHFLVMITSKDVTQPYAEVYKYYAKKNKCDYRVGIDIDEFISGDEMKRCVLLCRALGKAVQHLVSIKPELIDASGLFDDFHSICKEQSWV